MRCVTAEQHVGLQGCLDPRLNCSANFGGIQLAQASMARTRTDLWQTRRVLGAVVLSMLVTTLVKCERSTPSS